MGYERFYGRALTSDVLTAIGEGLTCPSEEDLVLAHLSSNYSYFGAIDKTLSGFVVLDDTNDNYFLYDARGDGAVWWQDHEERHVYLRFASLLDWTTFRELVAAGTDEDDARAMVAEPAAPRMPTGVPSSAVLLDRFQWLVWFLARPLHDRNGAATQGDWALMRSALGSFRWSWPNDEAVLETLESELPFIAGDPNLALYWLLHTSLLGMDDQRAQVVAEIATQDQSDLVQAFVAEFGALLPAGTTQTLPSLARRRALAWWNLANGEDGPQTAVTCLAADATAQPLTWALVVVEALSNDTLDAATVAAALADTTDSFAVSAVRAVLAAKAGEAASDYANHFLAGVSTMAPSPGPASAPDEPWWIARPLVSVLAEMATDPVALAGAVRRMLDHDPFSAAGLTTGARVWEMCPETQMNEVALLLPDARTLKRFQAVPDVSDGLERLRTKPDALMEVAAGLVDPSALRVTALRALYRHDLFGNEPVVLSWAARTVLTSEPMTGLEPVAGTAGAIPGAPAGELVARVIIGLPGRSGTDLLTELGAADDIAVDVAFGVLERLEVEEADYVGLMAAENLAERCLELVAPRAHEPQVFERLIALTTDATDRAVIDPLFSRLFDSGRNGGVDVVGNLAAEQVLRFAQAAVSLSMSHPSIHARNAARHRIDTLVGPSTQEFLISSLTQYGALYAASARGSGRSFDYGETEDNLLEDVVAALYGALVKLGTDEARQALVERLFAERRSFWRLGYAAGAMFDDDFHTRVMAALRSSQDPWGAGAYAFALADFVKQDRPAVDLLHELVGWELPDTPQARGFLRYALHIGLAAAVRGRRNDLIRAGWAMATAIDEPPLEPDQFARGTRWIDPLEALRDELHEVLSGRAETHRQQLVNKGRVKQEKQQVWKIKDAALGLLAGVTVARRLLTDQTTGEIWFFDTDGVIHAFDGYKMVETPLEATALGIGDSKAFLTGVEHLSDRVILWSKKARRFVELVRFDDRIMLTTGLNNGQVERTGLRFADDDAAATALSRLITHHESRKMVVHDSWYVAGHGAVNRIFYTPEPDGVYTSNRDWLMVHDGSFQRGGADHGSDMAAGAAHEQWVLEALRDRNATCITVEWMAGSRRPQDMTVAEWIQTRIRNESRDPVWHIGAMVEVMDQLLTSGYTEITTHLHTTVGAGVPDEQIAAFDAQRAHPVPETLRELWRRVGHASWRREGGPGWRLLSPDEVIAHRDRARQLVTQFAQATGPSGIASTEWLDGADLLVVTDTGEPATWLADTAEATDRIFGQVGETLWWDASLSRILAIGFLEEFARSVLHIEPLTSVLRVGEPVNPDAVVRRFEQDAGQGRIRFAEVRLDRDLALVSSRIGLVGNPGAVKAERLENAAKASAKAEKWVIQWLRKGYAEVVGP